jgi:hypothetical protein
MQILINGEPKRCIQLGTVGTIPGYRNQGLSRYLMENVINSYDLKSDIMFLFANEAVLDFYPKFGFDRYEEFLFRTRVIPDSNFSARKLNLRKKSDRDIINRYLSNRHPLTTIFGALDYSFITYWHLINIFPENLLLLDDEGIILITSEEQNELHIWDVIYTKPFDLVSAVSKIIKNQNIKSIIYHFPPDQLSYEYDDIITDNDSYLFVRGDFDLKMKHFKFPVTAQT